MKKVTITLTSLLAVSALVNTILLFPSYTPHVGQDDYTPHVGQDDYNVHNIVLLDYAVFRGTVVEIKGGPGGGETVTFRIAEVMSRHSSIVDRDLDNRYLIDVVSSDRRPNCFLDFEPDRTYIVHSMLENEVVVTDACWGTHPHHRAG